MKRFRFWWEMAYRVVFLSCGAWCLCAAFYQWPLTSFAWTGAAVGFLSQVDVIRLRQVNRGELDED